MYSNLFQAPAFVAGAMSRGVSSNFVLEGSPVINEEITNANYSKNQSSLRAGKLDDVTKQFGTGNLINNVPPITVSGMRNPGTSINRISNVSSSSLSNDYLLDQKLRNSGLYTKMKNKTLYSRSELVVNHANLNHGIL